MTLAVLNLSMGEAVEWGEQSAKVIGALPGLIVALAVAFVVWRVRAELPAFVGRLNAVEAFGLKLSLAAAGDAMSAAVEMARKHPNWQGNEAPKADQKRALARAAGERRLTEGAEILWVDDRPANNRYEARMLRGFGAMITFACTTEEALEALKRADDDHEPFDLILSDISRAFPTPNDKAGIEMLPRLRAAGHHQPVILYVGNPDAGAPTPAGAFGVTARADQLLNLILDALARVRGR
jgi:CheY-like chemotaxis protein